MAYAFTDNIASNLRVKLIEDWESFALEPKEYKIGSYVKDANNFRFGTVIIKPYLIKLGLLDESRYDSILLDMTNTITKFADKFKELASLCGCQFTGLIEIEAVLPIAEFMKYKSATIKEISAAYSNVKFNHKFQRIDLRDFDEEHDTTYRVLVLHFHCLCYFDDDANIFKFGDKCKGPWKHTRQVLFNKLYDDRSFADNIRTISSYVAKFRFRYSKSVLDRTYDTIAFKRYATKFLEWDYEQSSDRNEDLRGFIERLYYDLWKAELLRIDRHNPILTAVEQIYIDKFIKYGEPRNYGFFPYTSKDMELLKNHSLEGAAKAREVELFRYVQWMLDNSKLFYFRYHIAKRGVDLEVFRNGHSYLFECKFKNGKFSSDELKKCFRRYRGIGPKEGGFIFGREPTYFSRKVIRTDAKTVSDAIKPVAISDEQKDRLKGIMKKVRR